MIDITGLTYSTDNKVLSSLGTSKISTTVDNFLNQFVVSWERFSPTNLPTSLKFYFMQYALYYNPTYWVVCYKAGTRPVKNKSISATAPVWEQYGMEVVDVVNAATSTVRFNPKPEEQELLHYIGVYPVWQNKYINTTNAPDGADRYEEWLKRQQNAHYQGTMVLTDSEPPEEIDAPPLWDASSLVSNQNNILYIQNGYQDTLQSIHRGITSVKTNDQNKFTLLSGSGENVFATKDGISELGFSSSTVYSKNNTDIFTVNTTTKAQSFLNINTGRLGTVSNLFAYNGSLYVVRRALTGVPEYNYIAKYDPTAFGGQLTLTSPTVSIIDTITFDSKTHYLIKITSSSITGKGIKVGQLTNVLGFFGTHSPIVEVGANFIVIRTTSNSTVIENNNNFLKLNVIAGQYIYNDGFNIRGAGNDPRFNTIIGLPLNGTVSGNYYYYYYTTQTTGVNGIRRINLSDPQGAPQVVSLSDTDITDVTADANGNIFWARNNIATSAYRPTITVRRTNGTTEVLAGGVEISNGVPQDGIGTAVRFAGAITSITHHNDGHIYFTDVVVGSVTSSYLRRLNITTRQVTTLNLVQDDIVKDTTKGDKDGEKDVDIPPKPTPTPVLPPLPLPGFDEKPECTTGMNNCIVITDPENRIIDIVPLPGTPENDVITIRKEWDVLTLLRNGKVIWTYLLDAVQSYIIESVDNLGFYYRATMENITPAAGYTPKPLTGYNYIFKTTIIEPMAARQTLFTYGKNQTSQACLIFPNGEIQVSRDPIDSDIQLSDFVIHGGRKYTLPNGQNSESPIIPYNLLPLFVEQGLTDFLEEIEL
jgi:hypothetical protein